MPRDRSVSMSQYDVTHDLDAPHGLMRFRYDAASNYMFSRNFVSTPRELSARLQLSLRDIQSFFADSSLIEPRNHCLIVCLGPLNCVILYATAELYIYAPEKNTRMGRVLDQATINNTTMTYLQESTALPANAVSLNELSFFQNGPSSSEYNMENDNTLADKNLDELSLKTSMNLDSNNEGMSVLSLINKIPIGAENMQIADFIQNFPLVFKVISMSGNNNLVNNFSPSLFAQRCLESLLMHLTTYYGIRTDRIEALVSDITAVKSYKSIVEQEKRIKKEQKILAKANIPKSERSLYLFAIENTQAQVMVLRQEVKRMQTVLNRICDAVSSLLDDDADVGGMFSLDTNKTKMLPMSNFGGSQVADAIRKTMIRNIEQQDDQDDNSAPISSAEPTIIEANAAILNSDSITQIEKTPALISNLVSPAQKGSSGPNVFSPTIAAKIPGKENNSALAGMRTSLATDLMEAYLFQMMRYLKRLEAMDFSLLAEWEGECISLDRRRNYLLNFTVIVNILTIFASMTDFFSICFGANIPNLMETENINYVILGECSFSVPVTIAVMCVYLWWTNDKRINKKQALLKK